jgi:hypothetical protein
MEQLLERYKNKQRFAYQIARMSMQLFSYANYTLEDPSPTQPRQ